MIEWKKLNAPFDENTARSLEAGEAFLISGTLLTARDRAHKMISDIIKDGAKPPVNLEGQLLYYLGPSPAPPGKIIGSAGPTTSSRMDPFTDMMLRLGIRGMIGKGRRSGDILQLLPYYGAVYFSTFGGAGAYLNRRIVSAEIAAFEELGPEAIFRLEVKDFPVILVNDSSGGDLYADSDA